MITEAITTGVILGACAAAAWFAKARFQPGIEQSMARIEAEKAIVARHSKPRND